MTWRPPHPVEAVLLEYRTSLSLVGGIFLLILAARTAAGKVSGEREVNHPLVQLGAPAMPSKPLLSR